MNELEEVWPDPDRREHALFRISHAIAHTQQRDWLTPPEQRILNAMSHGLSCDEAADVLGIPRGTARAALKNARRILRAKNAAHAVAEALRAGLIT